NPCSAAAPAATTARSASDNPGGTGPKRGSMRGGAALRFDRNAMLMPMGNSYGRLLRVTSFGESHGPAVGVVVDGCPPRLPLAAADVQRELDRRRPGQSHLVSQRKEADQ